MKLLLPLGLLGLLGLIILIIIYIIKPNYQKKAVSSTFVWKLSLRFRKKRNPVSRLRDIILLICQILTVVIFAAVMAQPIIEAFRPERVNQKIVIIDGSASMLASADGETRFDRAVGQIRTLAKEVTADSGEITVIIAGESAEYLTVRTTSATSDELENALDSIAGKATTYCCHGTGDVEGAMKLAEQVLSVTPQADVLYYTGKTYIDKGDVEVKDVSHPTEYNVAILDSTAEIVENYYDFNITLSSYGRAVDVTLCCDVYGVNDDDNAVSKLRTQVFLESGVPQTLKLNSETTGSAGIYSYKYAYIYVNEEDSFVYDNTFYIYGGTKEKIRIQYASAIPSAYFRGCIMSLRDTLRNRWDIEYSEVNTNYKEAETEGFDFYIFERTPPKTLPTDGVVMFVSPSVLSNIAVKGSERIGIELSDYVRTGNMFLTSETEHPITDGINPEQIFVSECRGLSVSEDYEVLLSCFRSEPAYAIKKRMTIENGEVTIPPIIIMGFELQYSDAPLLLGFPKLFFRTFNYFFPSTVERYNFEVGESVELDARSAPLTVSGHGEPITLTELPDTVKLDEYGTYTLTQTLMNGRKAEENIYVKIPNAESDFLTPLETLVNPYVETVPEAKDYDLLLYVASALVLLLFVEWILHNLVQS